MKDAELLTRIGKQVKFFRIKKEMTQGMLAKECKTDSACISRIEAGKTNFAILTLRKIAIALEISISELLK